MAKILCPDCGGTGWVVQNGERKKPCLRPDCMEGYGYVEADEELQDKQPKWEGKSESYVHQARQTTPEEAAAMQAYMGSAGHWGF